MTFTASEFETYNPIIRIIENKGYKMESARDFLSKKMLEYNGLAVVIGKGPSALDWDPERYKNFFKIGINEASNLPKIDCIFSLDTNNFSQLKVSEEKPLISAFYPNVERRIGKLSIYKPTNNDLSEYFDKNTYAFNLPNSKQSPHLGEHITIGKFSSSVLINLLAETGCKKIVLVGIDGGSHRAEIFSDLETNVLASLQNSYSEQFADILLTKQKFPDLKIQTFRSEKNTILIGAEKEQVLAEEVLKHSIRSRTFLDIDFVKPDVNNEAELFARNGAGTPFSFQRFQMPDLARRQGRGIYFDSDMQVFGNVYELFNFDMKGNTIINCKATLGRPEQYSVFLAQLDHADWSLKEIIKKFSDGTWSYQDVMKKFIFEEKKATLLDYTWNSLEWFEPNVTKNIHYTDMGVQPWLSVFNPRSEIWVRELVSALDKSEHVQEALALSLANGWVRPSLKYQVEHDHFNAWTLPKKIRDLDREWIPPHLTVKFNGGMTNRQRIKWTLTSHVRRLMQSRSYQRVQKVKRALRKIF